MMSARARRVNRTAGDHQVRPSVIVEINEPRTPLYRGGFASEARWNGYICEKALAIVVVKTGHLVRKICLDDVEQSVAVIVNRVRAHPALGSAISVEGYSGQHATLAKGAVAVVHKKQTRRRIIS